MIDPKIMIIQAYSAFNERDIDGALALMNEDVMWLKASEGGKVRVRVHQLQEPPRECFFGQRGPPRIHGEQRSHRSD